MTFHLGFIEITCDVLTQRTQLTHHPHAILDFVSFSWLGQLQVTVTPHPPEFLGTKYEQTLLPWQKDSTLEKLDVISILLGEKKLHQGLTNTTSQGNCIACVFLAGAERHRSSIFQELNLPQILKIRAVYICICVFILLSIDR
jgi:hypothetical protein